MQNGTKWGVAGPGGGSAEGSRGAPGVLRGDRALPNRHSITRSWPGEPTAQPSGHIHEATSPGG
jgi:hypothetical protein